MSFPQANTASSCPSIPFPILDLKAQAVRLPLSKGAQILLSELLTWSGEKGYCWWSIPKIAKDLNWSVSAVWRKATELKRSGLLQVIPRPGRSNYWVPLPGPVKLQRIRNEVAPLAESRPHEKKAEQSPKRCTVPKYSTSTHQPLPSPEPHNVNALKVPPRNTSPIPGKTPEPFPHPIEKTIPSAPVLPPTQLLHQKPKAKPSVTTEHLCLIQEIERVTGDTWSRGHFINLVRQTDEQTIYAALSVTREKASLESGVNLGAYFTATLKGMMGLANLGTRLVPDITTRQFRSEDPPSEPIPRPADCLVRPAEPKSEPVDPKSLKRGWRLRYTDAGVEGMLSLVQRCAPLSVDPRSLWVDVRETFCGMEEDILVDRFLDTVVIRMKHAEKFVQATS